jgi:hypothetical protein
MARYWLGVAALDHVARGVAGGFCQLGHGRPALVARLSAGDWLIYYSPRSSLEGGEPVQAFTAIGVVAPGEPYVAQQAPGFRPTRRDVRYRKRARQAAIRPLLEQLTLTRGKTNWGIVMRRSLIELDAADFALIREAMRV